ncbi:hypothetical protein CLAFUW4_14615 [Fulvia fulva]|uniref:Uncharacterized protein n=1 Tax=Passalora fulva TaxID=5499 RepID=A0A9Q8UWD4_PASFU|nr:uncharacterized protein CLAFUR5_14444 [Fulvia fulva]KAK4609096.1 hypothetical protein CLAFUR4_14609 [Fulvia fulva]KAK4609864.1 hypothetical protein CLAFUR0_14609 [Fulvia fulva]UJO24893.1 hypothetical protein CLAFUR5_14444 [Fulvia fulva]WPV22929.1 hypothetical protein CLAFUW4_14615 [Fulvia fulva]WPV37411.1 hypothetical protein CLAFUW7_14618 [Fulvia fulva]
MCYANLLTWMKCGHFRVIQQMCPDAQNRQPASLCLSAHEPVATDIDTAHGCCPDTSKHPGEPDRSEWVNSLGIERTSGRGWIPYHSHGQDSVLMAQDQMVPRLSL